MRAYDFEYDGSNLSDFGFIICSIGSQGLQTLSNGAEITFNTLPVLQGKKHELSNIKYENCLTTKIQICKNTCNNDNMEISVDEIRLISRWLNREGYHKFKILGHEYLNYYFEASFNISRIELDGIVVALELDVHTNRPFAMEETGVIKIENTVAGKEYILHDYSDVEGHLYPKMRIMIDSDGDLDIFNEIENRHTIITGCIAGEVIEMDYPIIHTSESGHRIQDCFNWNFFRLANTYTQKINRITISIPCTIEICYTPYIKIGL